MEHGTLERRKRNSKIPKGQTERTVKQTDMPGFQGSVQVKNVPVIPAQQVKVRHTGPGQETHPKINAIRLSLNYSNNIGVYQQNCNIVT